MHTLLFCASDLVKELPKRIKTINKTKLCLLSRVAIIVQETAFCQKSQRLY